MKKPPQLQGITLFGHVVAFGLNATLVLQILHAPGPPRLSRIETLSRYSRCGDAICAEQWQGRYASPGESLRDQSVAQHHYQLVFTPLPESAPST